MHERKCMSKCSTGYLSAGPGKGGESGLSLKALTAIYTLYILRAFARHFLSGQDGAPKRVL